MKKKIRAEAAIRHQKADELLNEKPSAKVSSLSEDEAEKLIYGLEAHRIELEMQNEELVQARTAALETFEKYTELYDFAPYGYFSLSKEGRIIELNLCGSQMLGKVRTLLKNSLFGFFVSDDTKPVFNNFLGKVFDNKTKETCEVTLSTRNNSPKYVSLTGIVTEKGEQCLVTAADITEHKLAVETARQSETLLNTLIQAIPELIWLKNPDGVFLSCNAMFERLIGANRAEIIGKTDYDFVDRDLADSFRDNDRKAIAAGKPTRNEEWNTFKDDGHRALLETIKTPMYDSGGKLIGVLGIAHDITERKQVDEKLRLQSDAIEASIDGMALLNTDHNYIYMNKSHAKIYGYENAGELVGKSWRVLYDTIELQRFDREIMPELSHKGHYRGRVVGKRKDGNSFPQEISLTVLENSGLICVVWDITDRKQAEEALRESESLKNAMYEAIPDLMFRLDRQGVFLDYKANEKDLYTQTNQTIIGKRNRDIFPPEFADFIDRQIHIALETKTLQTFEYKLPMPGQGVRDYEARMIVSGPDEVTAIVRDITERKKAEQEIIFKNEELHKTNAEKDKFFSIIAHDLRGPLGSFMELTEMMAVDSHDFTPDQKKDLTLTMSHSARNIFNLLENLLEWSQMQRGNTSFKPKILGLKEVVNESVKTVVESAGKKAIELTVDVPGELKVIADMNMLQTVIRNLVSNAVKFTPRGGKVTIKASPGENNMAVIAVKDTGIGMSKDMLDGLFQIDTKSSRRGTEDEPGTGLGLLLCKEFIEKHDGRIWVESEENNGSTFYFTLPAERVKVSKG